MNINHEHYVIGALLKNSSSIDEVYLIPDDFEIESYRLAYQAIIDSIAANQVVDVITISSRLEKTNPGESWIAFLGTAAKDCVSVSNVSDYARLLKSESRNRKAKEICADMLNEIDSSEDSEITVDDAVRKLMDLSATRQNHECSISQALRKSLKMVELAEESEGTVGIPTGIEKLNEILGGFHDSDLYVVAARPAIGKTSVLLNFANQPSEAIGLISTEQPAEQIGIRLISINGKVNAQKMRNGNLDDFDYTKITNAVSRLHTNNNIWINDKSGIGIVDLIRQARKWKHKHNIKALYVDYIQRIKWTDQRIAKWEQVGNVVCALKELARDLNIPVIALAQVNRDVEKRNDKRPGMGDIANSSEIEKEADAIITLYRDEVYDENTQEPGVMEFNICKNRHGPTGYIRTIWIGEFMRIEDYDNRSYSQPNKS